jgi:hypothetical protein
VLHTRRHCARHLPAVRTGVPGLSTISGTRCNTLLTSFPNEVICTFNIDGGAGPQVTSELGEARHDRDPSSGEPDPDGGRNVISEMIGRSLDLRRNSDPVLTYRASGALPPWGHR